jgi:hypothetical protein
MAEIQNSTVALNRWLRHSAGAIEQNREICHEDNCRRHVACNFQHRAIVRFYASIREQDERQVLHVVRWRTILQVQGGHAAAGDSSHLQRLCGLMHPRFQRQGGSVPDVPGGPGAMHGDRRSCRPLQRQAIRRNGTSIDPEQGRPRLAAGSPRMRTGARKVTRAVFFRAVLRGARYRLPRSPILPVAVSGSQEALPRSAAWHL